MGRTYSTFLDDYKDVNITSGIIKVSALIVRI
jgi:hypothetical protein